MRVTPAQHVINQFGGVRAAARSLGRTPSCISHWKRSRDEGGAGGRVPSALQGNILAIAEREGLDITATDLIQGREVLEEVAG